MPVSTDQLFVDHIESFAANAILHVIDALVLVLPFGCCFAEPFNVTIQGPKGKHATAELDLNKPHGKTKQYGMVSRMRGPVRSSDRK